MPEAKTLAVGVAILTILGMTLALAVPMGPSFTGDDDPENSGVTSAQGDPVNNTTDNSSNDNSTDTDNDGDDDDPEDDDGSGDNGSSDSPPCESSGDSSDESDCGSSDDGTDDQDGEKDKDGDDDGDDGSSGDDGDGADDQDGEKDKDEGDDGTGGDGDDGTGDDGTDGNETDDGDDGNGENGTDVTGTCEENGLVMNNTIANEAFGTENESGPLSGQIHENEEQFQDAYVVFHEGSCIIATVDNNANGSGDGGPTDQLPGGDNGTDDGDNGTDDGDNGTDDGDNGTDDGDNGTDDGNETDDGNDGNETDDGNDGNETDDGTGDDGELGTCETGGAIQENTLANEIFGTENEDGPLSSSLHENEAQFQDGEPIVHEVSCGVATADNNASGGGDDLPESP